MSHLSLNNPRCAWTSTVFRLPCRAGILPAGSAGILPAVLPFRGKLATLNSYCIDKRGRAVEWTKRFAPEPAPISESFKIKFVADNTPSCDKVAAA